MGTFRGMLLCCALLLGGCAWVSAEQTLTDSLEAIGYSEVEVVHNKKNELTVTANGGDGTGTDIAKHVWVAYPRKVDELDVTLDGRPVLRTVAADLTERFGERPEGVTSGENISTIVIAAVALFLLAGGLGMAVTRKRRR